MRIGTNTSIDTDAIGKKAALLSVIEIGLGGIVHAFKIPGGGHVLSLNQGFILTRASLEISDRRAPALISTTAALLKSLSPAGQKLTPMLAITAQGQLFGLGILIGGNNRFGHILGMALLSTWGFIQPLCIYFLIFGKSIISMAEFYLKAVNQYVSIGTESVIRILVYLVVIKIVLGVGVVLSAHYMGSDTLKHYEKWANSKKVDQKKAHVGVVNPYRAALKDLTHPTFLISLGLMIFFFLFSQSSHAGLIWLMFRPIAAGYLIFLAIRVFPVERWVGYLRRKTPRLAETLSSALKYIK